MEKQVKINIKDKDYYCDMEVLKLIERLQDKVELLEQYYREAYDKGYTDCLRHNKSIFDRIDKAIDYLEQEPVIKVNGKFINIYSEDDNKLLSILRGEDNE